MKTFETSHTHADGRETETKAAEKAGKQSKSIKELIVSDLSAWGGWTNTTPDDFANHHGLLLNTVRRRFVDLHQEGRIRPVQGVAIRNDRGNDCTPYTLGKDPDLKPSRMQQLISENTALKNKTDRLVRILSECASDLEAWGNYADEYFKTKHGFCDDVEKYRAIIEFETNWK